MEKSLSMGKFHSIPWVICILYVLWYMGNEWNDGTNVYSTRQL